MNHIINNGMKTGEHVLEVVKHRVLGKPYAAWRAIWSETGDSDTALLMALKDHGITIEDKEKTMLYLVQDSHQMKLLSEQGVQNPTLLQILMTTKAFALSEEGATDRWTKIMREED